MTDRLFIASTSLAPLVLNLFSRKEIQVDEVVVRASSRLTTKRTRTTVQVGINLHIEDPLLAYVDHGCDPNCRFQLETRQLVALRSIATGEPITYFYPGTETELTEGFDCHCGTENCIGRVAGAFYLTHQQRELAIAHGHFTTFILSQLALMYP